MLQQQRVRIKPTSDGAEFINPEGECVVRTNGAVAAEIEAIIEAIPAGQEAVLLFTVEIPEEFDWLTADTPVRAEIPTLHGRDGYVPLLVVRTLAEDCPPDEQPELCAHCGGEINLGQPFVEVEGVPGRDYAHVECGYTWAG